MSDVPDICANCAHAYEAGLDPEALARASAIGVPRLPLLCRRYPQPVVVRSAHSCGEHSEVAERAEMRQAELLGLVLSEMLGAPGPGETERDAPEETRQ